MLQSFKKFWLVLLLACGQQAAWAFSLAGPIANNPNPNGAAHDNGDAWQVSVIGYGLPGDVEAPKNIGEGYRWNTPVLYYAEDANFLDYFGSNGVVAINQAFSIFNTSLTNVDANTSGLTEFPLNSMAMNYDASALNVFDVKSYTMGLMMEELGLSDPTRYVWTLHDRDTQNLQCGSYIYWVIQRNFDITASPLNQVQYSPYINGTLYSYYIQEECPASVPDPQAWCQMFPVDPLNFNPPVAGNDNPYLATGIPAGGYYVSLTRDDVAGMRYLLTTNYISYESPDTESVLLNSTVAGGTSYGAPYFLYSSNYTAFALAAQTNDPVTLSNLYPGLIINSYSNYPTVIYTTNYVFAYYTNLIGAPVGSPQIAYYIPVVTQTPVMNYAYNFANLIIFTNHYSASSTATLITTNVTYGQNGSPYTGELYTNISTQTITLPGVPAGDYYINTNSCGPSLILTNWPGYPVATTSYTTNLLLVSSNSYGLYQSETLVTVSTNYTYVAEPQVCGNSGGGGTTTNAPGLFQGIGHMQFFNAPFDSLLGQFFQPITNTYAMHLISNSKLIDQTYQRVIMAPDIVFSAGDITPGPDDDVGGSAWRSAPHFNQANVLPGLAGPGTIDPAVEIGFNKTPAYVNYEGQYELNQSSPYFAWGSFDGTTNAPVVYPNGTSIANLANQALIQITPTTLSNGTSGSSYSATQFSVNGAVTAFTPPYTWSAPSGLPPGLNLSSTGVLAGTPTQSGTFDFTLQLTDALARTVQWTYTITIQ